MRGDTQSDGHAIDDQAIAFYLRHGFVTVPENPRRLFRRLKDIRASLG